MTDPKLQPTRKRDANGRTLWFVLEKYRVRVGPTFRVTVPEGYVTNLGSIPRWGKFVVDVDEAASAFVAHDWMCNESHDGEVLKSGWSRWMADATLYELLVKYPLPAWKCWVIWAACRSYARIKGLV